MLIFVDSLMENTQGEGEKRAKALDKIRKNATFSLYILCFSELEKTEHTFESIFKILCNLEQLQTEVIVR